ncbi:MAG: right-handed parallel beta-helix repeat-containing protein [Armatimonadetes bacterium]|nr:right-handed parallel beta-helix repeat-containing protein [Armatimonadota bacterium]
MQSCVWVVLLALSGVAAQEAPVDVTVAPSGGEDDTAAVLAALEKCRAPGAHRLVFQPGRYAFHAGQNPANGSYAFVLQDFHDLTIEGTGAELVFHGITGGFLFSACSGIRVRGFVIDDARPAHSVGTVVGVGEKQFDVEVLPEFPVAGGEPVEAFMDFDPATRLPRKRGVDNYYGVESTELVRPQVLRVHTKGPVPMRMGVLVALRHKVYGPAAFIASRCTDVQVRDVTIYSVPGMGFIGSVSRDLTLERFSVLLKPGTQRLVSATADATHFGGCKGTITLRDCEFEGMGDDAVNIKSGLYLSVRQRLDDHAVLGQHNLKMLDAPDPGDQMELSHTDTLLPFGTLTVESVAVEPGEGNVLRVRFREPLPAELRDGDVLGNASRAPAVRISGCEVRRNRARGFLIQTRDAVIENCRFKDVTGGGVWVMTEVIYFFESIGTRDVVVRNCTFDNCGYGAALGEGVVSVFAWLKDWHFPPGPGVHRNIVVEGNTIRGADNAGIFVAGVDGITIRGNTLENVCRQPTRDECRSAIAVMSSRGIVVEGNTVVRDRQGEGCREPFRLGTGCEEGTTTVQGNSGF